MENQMADRPGKHTPTKIEVILGLFMIGKNLNRFDAEKHHDHCLHTTVSTLESYGLKIDREWERVPCLGGRATVRCKRYFLNSEPANIAAGRALLMTWRRE